MRAEGYSLERVDRLIDFLENKIETNTIMPAVLAEVQEQLDAIDAAYRGDPEFVRYYPRMLELQALIYGEGNEEQKALEFMKEAVRQTGSVGKLYSKLLKRYIMKQSKPAVAAQPQPEQYAAVAEVPRMHASRLHVRLLPTFNNRAKAAVAACLVLVALSAVAFAVVPQASSMAAVLTKHSQIASKKQLFDSLTAQYKDCSSALTQERGSVNTNDMQALDNYNQATAKCQAVLQQQNQAAKQYDALLGKA